ncbi:MAG: hypothetical protein Q4D02_02455 [Clostridia bacterium]|nr:hypothetical protein [Clostridia bacterium]
MREFEEIVDRATAKMGDYTSTYSFFKLYWESLLETNQNMRLSDAIEIKDMFDATHKDMIPSRFTHGGGKRATKKKKKRK